EEREATVAALWTVVFADGVEAEAEDTLLHQVEAILGVSPETSKKLHDAAKQARNQS
ncbi:MAG: TerB family tellurite resistance protein, partial [Planktomarina sp.]